MRIGFASQCQCERAFNKSSEISTRLMMQQQHQVQLEHQKKQLEHQKEQMEAQQNAHQKQMEVQ